MADLTGRADHQDPHAGQTRARAVRTSWVLLSAGGAVGQVQGVLQTDPGRPALAPGEPQRRPGARTLTVHQHRQAGSDGLHPIDQIRCHGNGFRVVEPVRQFDQHPQALPPHRRVRHRPGRRPRARALPPPRSPGPEGPQPRRQRPPRASSPTRSRGTSRHAATDRDPRPGVRQRPGSRSHPDRQARGTAADGEQDVGQRVGVEGVATVGVLDVHVARHRGAGLLDSARASRGQLSSG